MEERIEVALAAGIALLAWGCSIIASPQQLCATLRAAGYRDAEIVEPFDNVPCLETPESTSGGLFRATSLAGDRVMGSVCCDLFKRCDTWFVSPSAGVTKPGESCGF